jgi:hypothetical protein
MSEIVVYSDTIEHGGKQTPVRVLQFEGVEAAIRRRSNVQDRIETGEIVSKLSSHFETLKDESKRKHANYAYHEWYAMIVQQTVRVKGFALPPRHASAEEHAEAYFALCEKWDLLASWYGEADDLNKPPNKRYLRPDATADEKKGTPPKDESSEKS